MTQTFTLHREQNGQREQVCELKFPDPGQPDEITWAGPQVASFIAEMVDDMVENDAWPEGWDAILVDPAGRQLILTDTDWEPYHGA